MLSPQTHIPVTRKPAYRWLGSKSIAEKGSSLFNSDEPKKRVFGTEITNLRAKRNKIGCSSIRKQIGYKKHDQENTEQESKPAASKYVFGPFSPTGASKTNNNNVGKGRLLEIEALASTYQPQYCNHGNNHTQIVTFLIPFGFYKMGLFLQTYLNIKHKLSFGFEKCCKNRNNRSSWAFHGGMEEMVCRG